MKTLNTFLLFSAITISLPIFACANLITIDPDDFYNGENLSSLNFSYLNISTTSGRPVYATPLARSQFEEQGGFINSEPFGKLVFSANLTFNSEWFVWPEASGINFNEYNFADWIDEPDGLLFSFNKPVNKVSLLGLDLEGWGSDPIRWLVYDKNNQLIFSGTLAFYPPTGSLGKNSASESIFNYWDMTFSHPHISKLIVGGESQFTTLDRLQFALQPVPEPSTFLLFLLGFLSLTKCSSLKRNQKDY